MIGFVFLWGWLASRALRADPILDFAPPAWLWPLGLVAMVVGGALVLSCAALFVLRGQGTPAPFDPPLQFVAAGPYRYVRNPMYLGALTVLVGLALYARSMTVLLLAIAAWLTAHLFVVLVEAARSRVVRCGAPHESTVLSAPVAT